METNILAKKCNNVAITGLTAGEKHDVWAIEIDRFGPPQVMKKRQVVDPKPGPQQVLVEVIAAGVNPKDTYIRKGRLANFSGKKFPMKLGYDLAGVVRETGASQTRFKKGDRVFGSISAWTGGAYAEFACVPASELAALPESISFEDGASLPIAALTSYQALTQLAHCKKSDSVLVNGGSGGVGIFAIQLASLFGADVTTFSSETNLDLCRSLGANNALDYKAMSIKNLNQQFDIIFDAFGNLSFGAVKERLKPKGIYITTVPQFEIFKDTLLTLFGKKARLVIVKSNTVDLETIAKLTGEGKIKTIIDKKYSFDQVADAHKYSESHRARGKIVLAR